MNEGERSVRHMRERESIYDLFGASWREIRISYEKEERKKARK